MTYKISAMFFILWAALAFFTATAELKSDFSDGGTSSAAFASLVNTTANPNEINIDNATVGTGSNAISGTISFMGDAVGWVGYISKAAMLQSSIWEGWTQPFRVLILVLSAPFMFMLAKSVASGVTNFIGGIMGGRTG